MFLIHTSRRLDLLAWSGIQDLRMCMEHTWYVRLTVTDHMVYARSVPLAKEWRLRCILNIMLLSVTLFSFKNTLLWKTCFFIILWIITKCYSKEQSQEPSNLLNVKQSRCYFKVQRFDLMNAKHLKSTGNFF